MSPGAQLCTPTQSAVSLLLEWPVTHVKQDPDSSVQKSLANPNIFIFPIFLKEPEFVVTSKSLLKVFLWTAPVVKHFQRIYFT